MNIELAWKDFGDIPIDEKERIEEEFLHFKIGTPREIIWSFFDEISENGVHELMYGKVVK